MNSVLVTNPFRRYPLCFYKDVNVYKNSLFNDIFLCVCLEWIIRGKYQTEVYRLNCVPAHLLSY